MDLNRKETNVSQYVIPTRTIKYREFCKTFRVCLKLNITSLPYRLLKERQETLNKSKYKSEILLEDIIQKHCRPTYRKNYPCLNRYFGDFVFILDKVIFEADGSSHDNKNEYDEKRDELLTRAGFKVYRFNTKEIKTWENKVKAIAKEHGLIKEKPTKKIVKQSTKDESKLPITKKTCFLEDKRSKNQKAIEDLRNRQELFKKQLQIRRKQRLT